MSASPPATEHPRPPPAMAPGECIAKWRAVELNERSAWQSHFTDLCRMLGEPTPTPTDADPASEWYCIERGARKDTGDDGRAEVWRRGCFAWEYRGSAPTSMRRSTSCGRCGRRSGPDHL